MTAGSILYIQNTIAKNIKILELEKRFEIITLNKHMHYLCYLFQIICSSISQVVTKDDSFSTTPTMSNYHLHLHVAKGCVPLVHCIFSRVKNRNSSFLLKWVEQKVRRPKNNILDKINMMNCTLPPGRSCENACQSNLGNK